jgi:CubicO group peptidase (beta-lactamase class C family)
MSRVDEHRLAVFLERLVSADEFSGAVLVARGEETVFARAYGLASRGFGVSNSLTTRFNLGSLNKMFTAVAVAQLVERGALAFGDTVAAHLPAGGVRRADRITIDHLLTHTSGLGTYWNREFEANKTKIREVSDYLPLFVDEPLLFEPGAGWSYSNAAFIVLGAIIEAASGRGYFDYMREFVYSRAGMADTDAYDLDLDPPETAVGYTNTGAGWEPETGPRRTNLFLHVVRGGPAGGGFSTVWDLARFAGALVSHRLLSPELTAIVLEGKVDMPSDAREAFSLSQGARYGYGFIDERVRGSRIAGHVGAFPGLSARLELYLDLDTTVVVLSNYDPPIAERVATHIRGLVLPH